MCGINGFLSKKDKYDRLEQKIINANELNYRGPDESGIYMIVTIIQLPWGCKDFRLSIQRRISTDLL